MTQVIKVGDTVRKTDFTGGIWDVIIRISEVDTQNLLFPDGLVCRAVRGPGQASGGSY